MLLPCRQEGQGRGQTKPPKKLFGKSGGLLLQAHQQRLGGKGGRDSLVRLVSLSRIVAKMRIGFKSPSRPHHVNNADRWQKRQSVAQYPVAGKWEDHLVE